MSQDRPRHSDPSEPSLGEPSPFGRNSSARRRSAAGGSSPPMMNRHLQSDIELIEDELLALFAMVEEMIDKAVRSFTDRRRGVDPGQLVAEVLASDVFVDRREVGLENECLKVLALHQPRAGDLRRITAVLKINNDIERVGDLAVNVAERASDLLESPEFSIPPAMVEMADLAGQMLRRVLDAFVQEDVPAAREVMRLDDRVDALYVDVVDQMSELMRSDPAAVSPGLSCISASKHLERMADLATNVAEDLIYMIEGTIVRHQNRGLRTEDIAG